MMILIGSIGSGPALALSIGFNPISPIDVMMGDTFAVDVIVPDLGSEIVSAFDLDVSYNASLLSATGVTFGTNLGDPFLFEVLEDSDISTAGLIDFAAVSFLSDGELDALQGDSVLLASLEFDVVSTGQTSLSFLWGAGNDVKGRDNQVILPSSSPVPEPTTIFLIGTGLIGLAGFRKKFKHT